MKDAGAILQTTLVPYKKRLDQQRCLRAVLALLPPALARSVTAMRITGTTLYVGVDNHAFKMEFTNYKKPVVKALLTQIAGVTGLCREVEVENIKSYFAPRTEAPLPAETLPYPERSAGTFENRASTPELAAVFETIRKELGHAG